MKPNNSPWLKIGTITYWVTLPGLWLFLNRSKRTRVLVENNGSILLVRPWLGSGEWMLPGGGMGKYEAPAAAAARELHEETGISAEPKQLQPIGKAPFRRHGLKYENQFYYLRLEAQPAALPGHELEIARWHWVPIIDLPGNCSPEVHTAIELARGNNATA